jgi:hypothetical protein
MALPFGQPIELLLDGLQGLLQKKIATPFARDGRQVPQRKPCRQKKGNPLAVPKI